MKIFKDVFIIKIIKGNIDDHLRSENKILEFETRKEVIDYMEENAVKGFYYILETATILEGVKK